MNEQVKVSLSGSYEAVKRLKETNCILSKLLDENDPPKGSNDWDKTIWEKSV
jgi:hypothetical protein